MQIAALAVTAVLCAAVIRRGAPEAALVLVLAAGCWMLMLAAGALGSVVEAIGRLAGRAGLDSTLVEPVLKTAAISILTKVTGEFAGPPGRGAQRPLWRWPGPSWPWRWPSRWRREC